MSKCPKCGGGVMLPEVVVEFYERIFFEKCVNCGKVVEVGSVRFAFRPDDTPSAPDVLPADHPFVAGRK